MIWTMLGRRVRENVDGLVSLDWYSAEDIVLETDATGADIARYTHGPGIDNPLTMRRNGLSYHYHEDPLGSIVLLTDATKAVVKSYTYDAFGRILAQTGTLENPYTYTAREWDPETGLYYYRARHYDPNAGRFLQTDPLPQRWDEMNRYAYVLNNPANLVDPYGTFTSWWGWGGTIIGGVGGSLLLTGTSPAWGTGLMIVGGGMVIYDTYQSMMDAFQQGRILGDWYHDETWDRYRKQKDMCDEGKP
jgi:RHS repeat-associated protein